ncbi:MAG: PIN domain-containing protein [Chloroflexota bacterium]|nr:PIN domain-containing protein [bacterium]MDE2766467.1 PIN domain-containing protein [Chloroflexota bacterium]MDE2899360.1 PIN domain-containing protein [Chloroflexota bacterium]
MASNPARVYWDSCVYLDFLRGGHPNRAHLRAVLRDWEVGKVTLVTSTLTIAEVLYVPGIQPSVRLDESRRNELMDPFRPTGDRKLTLVELTRPIAEAARDLCWSRGIRPKDAVHVASALAASCAVLHTHDEGLQKKSRQVGGDPILEITQPAWTWQTDMQIP